ncbi:hypothetical protein GBF35_27650 [Nonomuraea phyllanthi]|uniref:hypothetical protein n=1 Tax=Nonomuraea phyllanthi TaxID=2219224 RepID=UPI00129345B9|nr:hypothetical protein [Nonomuraea phyllanthi]QFY09915.1 hypothetical protein GBF35_27650 [Nonomuraea phyllanthi]
MKTSVGWFVMEIRLHDIYVVSNNFDGPVRRPMRLDEEIHGYGRFPGRRLPPGSASPVRQGTLSTWLDGREPQAVADFGAEPASEDLGHGLCRRLGTA